MRTEREREREREREEEENRGRRKRENSFWERGSDRVILQVEGEEREVCIYTCLSTLWCVCVYCYECGIILFRTM